jgi:CheY-like chemotaxis protein
MTQPLAFLSYTRKDDEFFGGYISAFRKTLENAVHVVSGQETFSIFQDVEGIVIGENWRKKLADVIQDSSFFVPMLSPLFFNSKPCRAEIELFLAHEKALGRDDLLLPIYFLSSAKLEKEEERDKDPIASQIAARQMFDWREKANVPLQEPAARAAILNLAGQISAAIERLETSGRKRGFAPATAAPAGGYEDFASDPRLNNGVSRNTKREELVAQHILWVDDEPENNEWERRALESYGVRFALAHDTDEAIRLLSGKNGFAAVISDMGRPGDRNAGFTLLERLRESPERTQPYFIYTSAQAAKRATPASGPQPQGITADPDALVEMVVAALRPSVG